MTNDELVLTTLMDLKNVVGTIDGKLDASLAAHAQRLEDLEGDSKWQWRVQLATLPVIAALHQVAAKFGITRN